MVKTINIRGVLHAYELTAPIPAKPVLVFIHGWLLSSGYWQPLIEQLASDYQCLSYDLRGFGQSQLPPDLHLGAAQRDSNQQGLLEQTSSQAFAQEPAGVEGVPSPYSPLAYAQDLVMLMQRLEITTAWLVGHSLGGSIALWAADQAPDIVQGVICVNSGGGIYLKEEFEKFRSIGEQLVRFRPQWLPKLPMLDLLMARMDVAHPIPRQWGKQRILDLVVAHPEAARGALLESTTEAEVHCLPQVVSRLQQPVYFIAGDKDTIMEPKYVNHLASFHSLFGSCGENVTEILECGHLSMVEQPDVVAEQVRSRIAKHLLNSSS